MLPGDEGDVPGTIQAFTLGTQALPQLPASELRFTKLTPERESDLAAAAGIAVSEVDRRLADGGIAFLALVQDRIACYGWVLRGMLRIPDLNLQVPLPEGHTYIWDCRTVPDFRGRGIFPALLHFMLEELRGLGVRQAWAATAPGNAPSVRAFAKAGFRRVANSYGPRGTITLKATAEATAEETQVLYTIFPPYRPT